MKKIMIFSGVLLIGTTASLGILRPMHKEHPQNDGQVSTHMMHHPATSATDSQEAQPDAKIHQDSSDVHAIKGRVVDGQGNPVEAIEVFAAPTSGILLGSQTNKEGYFSITGLDEGTYQVYTREKDGPCCPWSPFYSGGLPTQSVATVTVLKDQIAPHIVLETAPKLARLTGRVLDSQTNEPILDSQIILRRVDNPDYYYKTGPHEKGDFVIPVPLVPITIEVVSEQHERWNYVRDDLPRVATRVDSIKLNRGESRKLEVRLRKRPAQ